MPRSPLQMMELLVKYIYYVNRSIVDLNSQVNMTFSCKYGHVSQSLTIIQHFDTVKQPEELKGKVTSVDLLAELWIKFSQVI